LLVVRLEELTGIVALPCVLAVSVLLKTPEDLNIFLGFPSVKLPDLLPSRLGDLWT
jgi:hypothetical protein